MTPRMHENLLKVIFFIAIVMVLLFQSLFTSAQSLNRTTYKGFNVHFGARLFTINSNIGKLDLSRIVQGGGHIGLVYGNHVVRTSVGGGYYSSVGTTAGTIDQYEASARVNFYPLFFILKKSPRVEPYVSGGVAFNNFRFYGFYINREPGNTNHSTGEAPFLGSTQQVNADFGGGVQVKILDEYDFVHFYSEIRYGHDLSSSTRSVAFADTAIKKQIQLNMGISFGICR